jgi:SAM-dependent methyltransferase
MELLRQAKYRLKYNVVKRMPYNKGYCPLCEAPTFFIECGSWLRDQYICHTCGSIPRNRALVQALNFFFPDWKELTIHESSPGGVLSDYLERNAKGYSSSHYYQDIPRGQYSGKFRSEDLSQLTFPDNSFDLFITSDVFEHVMEPARAFREIARVLKPGGAHLFTMPWYPQLKQSVQRAKMEGDSFVYLQEPVYHGNPIDETGSLVTYDWGLDFPELIHKESGLYTTIYIQRDRKYGIDGAFLEVFKSVKL